jgi:hypothetical protein
MPNAIPSARVGRAHSKGAINSSKAMMLRENAVQVWSEKSCCTIANASG